jgi:magnesium chelatase subunit D
MIEKVKGLVFELLEDAATRGDRVALVAFRGGVPEGTVVLPLTKSVALARRRLRQIPLSGQTPLADALRRGRLLLRQERFKHANSLPLLVLVTDGLPTVPLRRGGDPVADVLAEARALQRDRIACLVADASSAGAASCAPEIARLTRGRLVPVAELV